MLASAARRQRHFDWAVEHAAMRACTVRGWLEMWAQPAAIRQRPPSMIANMATMVHRQKRGRRSSDRAAGRRAVRIPQPVSAPAGLVSACLTPSAVHGTQPRRRGQAVGRSARLHLRRASPVADVRSSALALIALVGVVPRHRRMVPSLTRPCVSYVACGGPPLHRAASSGRESSSLRAAIPRQ